MIHLSSVQLKDLDALCVLERASFLSDGLSYRQFRRFALHPQAVFLVAREKGRVAGYVLMLRRKDSRWGRIYSLAVARDFQGRGLGRRLMKAALAAARKHRMTGVRLEVRARAKRVRQFYQSLGFFDVKPLPGYYADGADGIRMAYSFQES